MAFYCFQGRPSLNLVLYDRGVTPNKALWSTGTAVSPADSGFVLRTLYSYDALGNIVCVEQHGNVSGAGCADAPSLDAASSWRVRRFSHDSLGRLLTAKNPESGLIRYVYDDDGELLQKTSPAPNQLDPSVTQTISYCYDELHRMTGKGYGGQSCPLASPVVSYAYDSGPNAKGKLVQMTDQAGTAAYGYDVLGRQVSEVRSLVGAGDVPGNLPQHVPGLGLCGRLRHVRLGIERQHVVVLTIVRLPQPDHLLYLADGQDRLGIQKVVLGCHSEIVKATSLRRA